MTPEVATVIAASIAATGGIAAAAISAVVIRAHRGTREELRENTAKTDQVLDQVANDHDSNLRNDLDQVQADVGHLGTLMAQLMTTVKESITHSREHDAGARLAFEGLQRSDKQLDERLRAVEGHDERSGSD